MSRVQCLDNSSDNLAAIVIASGGVPMDLDSEGVTRVVINVDDYIGSTIDSNVISMTWNEEVIIDGVAAKPIQFKGSDAGLPVGVYRDCVLRIFDATHPNGLTWPDPITFVVTG